MAEIKTLKGTLVYVQVQKPVDCFVKEKGKEWKASIVVDEDTADAWADEYPKQAAVAVKTADFKGIYKIDPPIPDAKKQYIITLRRNTEYVKDDVRHPIPDIYKPKVLLKLEDGQRTDITDTILVANGSKGALSVSRRELKVGNVANLQNILVTELIEYEAQAHEAGSEFDDDDQPANKPAKAKTVAPKTSAKAVGADNTTEDDPF